MLASFQNKELRSLHYEFKAYSLQFLFNFFIGILIACGYAGIIVYGISLVHQELISAGTLVVFLFYLDNLTNPCITFMSAYTATKEHFVKIQRISEIFDHEKSETSKKTTQKLLSVPNIHFNRVTVTGDNEVKMLKNISCIMPKEKITVILGANGSGKTTIISLLLGFLIPSHGTLLFDKKSVSEFSSEELHTLSAYVPQEISPFKGTIRENIAFGNTHATFKDIQQAARMANATTFIQRMPRNYSFQVGERGNKLSGGQRQRILLARAFLKSTAKIVIMDEPLSAQDIKSHKIIIKNIKKYSVHKTVIIVSNILDIIEIADHIIVLNNGKHIAQGKNISLLQQKHVAKLLVSLT